MDKVFAWFQGAWKAIGAGLLAVLAVMAVNAARREKKKAEKWQEKAVSIEEGTVTDSLETANAASTQAKLHEQRARDRKEKAEARLNQIGEVDEDVADILDRWSRT